MAVFGIENDEVVFEWVHKKYGHSEFNRTDYCQKVLKVELLIRLFMDITYCSYDDAELKMLHHFKHRKQVKPPAAS